MRLTVLENVPDVADQVKLAALEPEPARVTVPPSHTVAVEPAKAVGAGVTLMVTVLVAEAQGEVPVAVRVSTTLPDVMEGV